MTHQWAFVASMLIGIALVASAPSARARLAAAIYAASVAALFGSSALYHRVAWITGPCVYSGLRYPAPTRGRSARAG